MENLKLFTMEITNQIREKVNAAIAAGHYTTTGNNYVETHISIDKYGDWESVCINQYGQRYGNIMEGSVNLTTEEAEWLRGYNCPYEWEYVKN